MMMAALSLDALVCILELNLASCLFSNGAPGSLSNSRDNVGYNGVNLGFGLLGEQIFYEFSSGNVLF